MLKVIKSLRVNQNLFKYWLKVGTLCPGWPCKYQFLYFQNSIICRIIFQTIFSRHGYRISVSSDCNRNILKNVKLLQASAWTVDFIIFWRVFAICHNCVTARHAGRAPRVRNAIKRPFAISIYAINKKNFSIVVLVTVYKLVSQTLTTF